MRYATQFRLGNRTVGNGSSTYFIADIGANHDGSLDRAKELIRLAAAAGADCAKFQHFSADKIVSQRGFESLKIAHQAAWEKPVYQTYEDYSIDRHWDEELAQVAQAHNIHWMTTPYDHEAVDNTYLLLHAYKIGSGDITYHQLIRHIAKKLKPAFMSTGASSIEEVVAAVDLFLTYNDRLCLLQCNTNYTGDPENFRYVTLKCIQTYLRIWPNLPVGLSDHTPGHSTVLGAVALGACVIEKHFTDDPTRKGPDHAFALAPGAWRSMIAATRELELALGDGIKRVEENEKESVIVQRRALRAKHLINEKDGIREQDLEALRPCPQGAFPPSAIETVTSHLAKTAIYPGAEIYPKDLG